MSYTLQGLRDYVRTHMDLDSEELPDVLIDAWCGSITTTIASFKPEWPFLEAEYDLTTVVDQTDYPMTDIDPLLNKVALVYGDNRTLHWIGKDEARQQFPTQAASTGSPWYFTEFAGNLRLLPTPSTAEDLTILGYRFVQDWTAQGAGAVPDLPDEFHDCIRNFLLAEAFLQQEDPEMAAMYGRKAEQELLLLSKRYGDTPRSQPAVIGGGSKVRRTFGRVSYPFDWG